MARALLHRAVKRWQALLLSALCLGAAGVARADNPAEATITVTPEATLSLAISATTYAFGAVDVNTSTHSATAITLTNDGEVSVTVNKSIADQSNPSGWTAATSAGHDTYVLYVATASVRPAIGDFGPATLFGAEANATALTGTSGITPVLAPVGANTSVDLWFRLDMPTTVSSGESKTIRIEFQGVAQ